MSLAEPVREDIVISHVDILRVALIGSGIQKSRTPHLHMSEASSLGMNLEYNLEDTDKFTGGTHLNEIVDRLESEGYLGANVTFPYKKEAVALVDEVSDAVRMTGAVNTIVFRDGKRFGHNTDYWGFSESFKTGLPGADTDSVLLLGAGGAGGAVAHALVGLGVQEVQIFDQNRLGAEILAENIPAAVIVDDLQIAAKRACGIVNATPMGMAKLPGMAIPAEYIEPRHYVSDIVYFPLETELLKVARARGCRTLDGSGMAVYQAVRAFELFTGRKPDPKRMWASFIAYADSQPESTGKYTTGENHEK